MHDASKQCPQTSPAISQDLVRYWDGIAAYLSTSVKTAQRYERLHHLPVHRKNGDRGRIVYAFRSELDAWLRHNPPVPVGTPAEVPPAPARRISPRQIAGALLLASLPVALGLYATRESTDGLLMWRVENNRLAVFDRQGKPRWEHQFDHALLKEAYAEERLGTHYPIAAWHDLDGDGSPELLFTAVSPDGKTASFYCFERTGRIRFQVEHGITLHRVMEFGEPFGPPFMAFRFDVLSDTTGRKSVFVTSQDPLWYPAVVQKYDSRGTLLGEYWHAGRLWYVKAVQWEGRQVLLVGGTNNEFRGASLSVLDYNNVHGASPAENPRYRCRNCPDGTPLAYFVFPRMEISSVVSSWPDIHDAQIGPSGMLVVNVLQSREPLVRGGPLGFAANVVYAFSAGGQLYSAELAEGYTAVHAILRTQKLVDHPIGPRDEAELFPVRRWNSTGFDLLTAAQKQEGPGLGPATSKLANSR